MGQPQSASARTVPKCDQQNVCCHHRAFDSPLFALHLPIMVAYRATREFLQEPACSDDSPKRPRRLILPNGVMASNPLTRDKSTLGDKAGVIHEGVGPTSVWPTIDQVTGFSKPTPWPPAKVPEFSFTFCSSVSTSAERSSAPE